MIHLKLEVIGDRENQEIALMECMLEKTVPGALQYFGGLKRKPWVAQIRGTDSKFGLRREFVRGEKCYLESSGNGNRGVYMHYDLIDGVYEIHELISWARSVRRFVRVAGDDCVALTKEQVIQWAKEADSKRV